MGLLAPWGRKGVGTWLFYIFIVSILFCLYFILFYILCIIVFVHETF